MTYDYKCSSCGNEFTVEKSMNDNSKIICKCGSEDVNRKYSSPVFKINCTDFCGKIGK